MGGGGGSVSNPWVLVGTGTSGQVDRVDRVTVLFGKLLGSIES